MVCSDGIFYINNKWVHFLSFDPESSQKYSEFKMMIIRQCDLSSMVSKAELKAARYSYCLDVLLIETSKLVFEVRFLQSLFDMSRLNSFFVSILRDPPTLLEGWKYGFSLLSDKHHIGTFSTSHELCLFKADPFHFPVQDRSSSSESRLE